MLPKLKLLIKILLSTAFISACIGINAIAVVEIKQTLQARRANSADNPPHPSQSGTIQNTAAVEPQSNQLVSVPAQTQRSDTPIALRPVNNEGFINSPQPIQISPVLDEATELEATQVKSTAQVAPKYGHLRYAEGKANEMMLIASYAESLSSQRAETLHPEAAKALLEMIAAARVEGIWLIPASGFRTITQQRTLFNAQIERKGSPEIAAQVSAPPGYSEHHTGYAVDLADGSLPQSQDISEQFAQSPAYAWLLKNAQNHGFELSFPDNNPRGIAFEPWHWRYVASGTARGQLNQPVNRQAPTADTRSTTGTFIE